MTEQKVWQISRRQATVGMLLVSDWARIVSEAELAAAVADRLSRCENASRPRLRPAAAASTPCQRSSLEFPSSSPSSVGGVMPP